MSDMWAEIEVYRARIAKLEAERNQIDQMYRAQAKVSGDLNTGLINAAARIAKLEVDYARAEKVAVSLHAITKKAMDRIAELEAERSDYITETEALVIRVRGENAARIAELEAEIARRDSHWARNLAGDLIAAGESAPDPRAVPRLNIKLEYRGGGISGTRSLDVIRVEAEDDGSFTAVSDYWPPA